MYAQSVIQVRIDKPLKEEVGEIFSSIGLDMSTAIRMFFQRCRGFIEIRLTECWSRRRRSRE